jgi:hypothetical protein
MRNVAGGLWKELKPRGVDAAVSCAGAGMKLSTVKKAGKVAPLNF